MTWLTWVIAVLCAAAVGARIGRLTVRPPSLARTSVAVAAVAVAAAAAVRTPTVSVVLGPADSDVPMLTFLGCWVVVLTATSLIGAATLPWMSRRMLHGTTVAVVAIGVADLIALGVTGEPMVATVYVIVCALTALLNGVQYIAWHPLGRAIAYYLAGIAMVAVILLVNVHDPDPRSGWWATAIIVISFACTSVMLSSWFSARRDLHRTHALWSALAAAHPEVATGDYQSATPVLAANDRVSQILDGLYLHAGAGIVAPGDGADDAAPRTRARDVAAWLRDPDPTPIDPEKLSTPPGLSDRRWVTLIAREYDRAGR